MKESVDRRRFLAAVGATGAAVSMTSATAPASAAEATPALLGGTPVRKAGFAGWPRVDAGDEKAVTAVLKSGHWFRGGGDQVDRFESAYAAMMGAKHCVAVANGTSSLFASLAALGVGPGDEVIVPPYTFIATVNAVLLQYALPVFVDTDPATFQIDARKIEEKITDRTAAILPVHLGGNVVDLDAILEIGRKHKLPVIEDACQSHLAEWKGRKVGTWGATGCFSFQVTKNLPSGEGGAILTADAELAERCYAFQNNSRGRSASGYNFSYLGGRGANLRMTEFQGALLQSQMTRIEVNQRTREENAKYLTSQLREVPGIAPAEAYPGCTRNAYHLYMFRYDSKAFAGLPRAKFIGALTAEGIPCSSGYGTLNKQDFLRAALASKGFQRIYPKAVLDGWVERSHCPANDRLCEEAVWFTQTMFLGPRDDMDQIAEAVRKVQKNASRLAKA
jgi:perosamine synthetase